MLRDEFGPRGRYCVRYDGAETLVDIVGSLTEAEIGHAIAGLSEALKRRREFNAGDRRKRRRG